MSYCCMRLQEAVHTKNPVCFRSDCNSVSAVQVSIDGLRSVPLDILKRLDVVPAAYLQELGEDKDLFAELPAAVQRQVQCNTWLLNLLHIPWAHLSGTFLKALHHSIKNRSPVQSAAACAHCTLYVGESDRVTCPSGIINMPCVEMEC